MPTLSGFQLLSHRIALLVIGIGIASGLLVAAYVAWVATRIDDLTQLRERTLVTRAIADQAKTVSREQQTITVWDDTVLNTRAGDQPKTQSIVKSR